MTRRSREEKSSEPLRHQSLTPFTAILKELLDLERSAAAAVLVDAEGEAVDYAGSLPVFDMKVAAAHLRVVFDDMSQRLAKTGGAFGGLRQLLFRAGRRSYCIHALPDGYALVLLLKRRAFALSPRALAIAEQKLVEEASWRSRDRASLAWFPAQITPLPRDRRRPLSICAGADWQPVEVLGSIMGMGRERGYRCRLRSGAELTLIREPAGIWYTDERILEPGAPPPDAPSPDASRGKKGSPRRSPVR